MRTINTFLPILFVVSMITCAGAEQTTLNDACGINGISFSHIHDDARRWQIATDRLDAVDRLGLEWHRCDLWWHLVEPQKGNFSFSYFDQAMDMISSRGHSIMPILSYNPAWKPEQAPITEDEQKLFARYVSRMVERYKDRIKDWEIWNEPNIIPFWRPEPSAEAYTHLLKHSYQAAKKADEECNVIGFCTSNPDYAFIEKVYELGGGAFCDTLSYHHYNSEKDDQVLERELMNIKYIMNRYGDSAKDIWITEIGLPTAYNSDVIEPFFEGEQAVWLVRKILTAYASGVVGKIFWFTINDWSTDPYSDGHWGVYDVDLLPKPAAYAYRTLINVVGDKKYAGSIYLTETTRCILFNDEDDNVTGVLWSSRDKEDVQVFLDTKKYTLLHIYGEKQQQELDEEYTTLEVTSIPFYIEGLARAYLVLASITPEQIPLFLIPGERRDVQFNLTNSSGGTRTMEVSMMLKGGKVAMKEFPERIKKRESITFTATIEAGLHLQQGWHDFYVSLNDLEYPEIQPCRVKVPFKIIEPVHSEIAMSATDREIYLVGRIKNVSLVSLTGDAYWGLEPSGDVMRRTKSVKELNPNEMFELEGRLRSGYGEIAVTLNSRFEISGDNEFSMTKRVAFVPFLENIQRRIDGNFDDWPRIDPIQLNRKEQILTVEAKEFWKKDDISGKVRICSDPDNIYIAAEIHDDAPAINPYEEGDIWRGDGLELYIGFGGPRLDNWYTQEDVQIGLSPGYKHIPPSVWIWQVGRTSEQFDDAEIAVQKTPDGYNLEARLPVESLGIDSLTAPVIVGFDIALNDLDDAEREKKDCVLMWNGTEQNWRDPSHWGALFLLPPEQ